MFPLLGVKSHQVITCVRAAHEGMGTPLSFSVCWNKAITVTVLDFDVLLYRRCHV